MRVKKIKPKYYLIVFFFWYVSQLEAQITINDVLGDYVCNVKHLQTFTGPVIGTCSGTKLRFVHASPSICNNNAFTPLDSGCLTTFFVTLCCSRSVINADSTIMQCGGPPGYPVDGKYYPNDSIYFKIKSGADPDFYEYFGKKIQTSIGLLENGVLNTPFEIYPNPADDKVYLSSTEPKKNINIILYNTFGEICANKNNTTEIDVSDLPNGIYFLKVKSEKGVVNKKVVVQH